MTLSACPSPASWVDLTERSERLQHGDCRTWVEDAPEGGACFVLAFPANPPAELL